MIATYLTPFIIIKKNVNVLLIDSFGTENVDYLLYIQQFVYPIQNAANNILDYWNVLRFFIYILLF